MKQNVIETLVGFIVIVVAIGFFIFAYKIGNSSRVESGYMLKANFQNAEGIVRGSDVMLAGVKIGSVIDITLDKSSFFALLTICINNDIKLPKDTSIAIVTGGILGSRYISVTPGSSEENLAIGEQIKYTQSAVNIESLIGKLIYSFGSGKK
ncbi:outer membrane lipid asymmetry maintenance protein MlaD [Rickettsia endosymbiont of Culicoides newsteadi]|uniref:outer membrane lipid asymmetry maintenance protein MlaD n=1 Tax=Rickettsia endosymbiont of Culicoides newsteadi TaxID=1961830 RepID=UPI000B9C0490|nr:outer membrane lipid asymmetry maintenance protein MlaD [Rickettsia endosymbiont of Culicoides newsteadi]OZG32463.1 outer membrane lipid asymmetry maintenance protein MlaD [Rickettsia endosymbiont of Culicoides newsteadi]